MGYLRLTAPGNVASYDCSILGVNEESQLLDAVYEFHILIFKVYEAIRSVKVVEGHKEYQRFVLFALVAHQGDILRFNRDALIPSRAVS